MSCLNYVDLSPQNAIIPSCSSGSIFFVSYCVFYGMNYGRIGSNGGAVSVSWTSSSCIFEHSFFHFCSSSNGGCLYICSSTKTEILNCCFFCCYASSRGQAIYHQQLDNSGVFQIEGSNTVYCPSNNQGNNCVVFLEKGNTHFSNYNLSNCHVSGYDCIYFYAQNTIDASFIHLSENKVDIVIDVDHSYNGHINNINMIENIHNNGGYRSIIHDNIFGVISVEFSIFRSNSFPILLSNNRITFIDCLFYNNVFTNNNIVFYPSTIVIKVIWNCNNPNRHTNHANMKFPIWKFHIFMVVNSFFLI